MARQENNYVWLQRVWLCVIILDGSNSIPIVWNWNCINGVWIPTFWILNIPSKSVKMRETIQKNTVQNETTQSDSLWFISWITLYLVYSKRLDANVNKSSIIVLYIFMKMTAAVTCIDFKCNYIIHNQCIVTITMSTFSFFWYFLYPYWKKTVFTPMHKCTQIATSLIKNIVPANIWN